MYLQFYGKNKTDEKDKAADVLYKTKLAWNFYKTSLSKISR